MKYLEALQQDLDSFEFCLGANEQELQFAQQQLEVVFPEQYSKFLSECGMCSFGDTRIEGIFKTQNSIDYCMVDSTLELRKTANLPKNLIVLEVSEQEFVLLYQVDLNQRLEDGCVYGAQMNYDDKQQLSLGKLIKHYDSFQEYFQDFIDLAD